MSIDNGNVWWRGALTFMVINEHEKAEFSKSIELLKSNDPTIESFSLCSFTILHSILFFLESTIIPGYKNNVVPDAEKFIYEALMQNTTVERLSIGFKYISFTFTQKKNNGILSFFKKHKKSDSF